MNKVVGVRFEKYGTVRAFDTGHFVLKRGDRVVVETQNGLTLGVVCTIPTKSAIDLEETGLKKIARLASPKDLERFEKSCELEREVYTYCFQQIKTRSLPMFLKSVERVFDGSRIIVYFTAEGRVDFRELVKDLVQRFHTRIEMRQVGVRHQAKMVGALGTCGRQLCCSGFLSEFAPVSIKMAKEQNLSLNPSKISGMCGRLMCCLTYEHAYYAEAKRDIPKIGKKIQTARGEGKVIRQNVLRQTLTVLLPSDEEVEIPFREVTENRVEKNSRGRVRT